MHTPAEPTSREREYSCKKEFSKIFPVSLEIKAHFWYDVDTMEPNRKGYFRYEVAIGTVIIGVLTLLAVAMLAGRATKAKQAVCDRNISMIKHQLDLWYAEKGRYPQSSDEMKRFMKQSFREGKVICPITGRSDSYTIDPVTHEVRCNHRKKGR